jgi:hypothetical protein
MEGVQGTVGLANSVIIHISYRKRRQRNKASEWLRCQCDSLDNTISLRTGAVAMTQ